MSGTYVLSLYFQTCPFSLCFPPPTTLLHPSPLPSIALKDHIGQVGRTDRRETKERNAIVDARLLLDDGPAKRESLEPCRTVSDLSITYETRGNLQPSTSSGACWGILQALYTSGVCAVRPAPGQSLLRLQPWSMARWRVSSFQPKT